MSAFPEDFTPDLRRLKSWPSILHSPWRQPYLVDLTFGEIFRLVDEFVVGRGLKILDVGCGRGWLSLELSREGHDVLGIDSEAGMIESARRTMDSDPEKSSRGRLEYQLADFVSWKDPGKEFDLVVFSRVLHHIPKPERALSKAHRLLRPGGRIICVEYGYDQFERRGATWFYHMRRALEQAGWYGLETKLSESSEAGVKQIIEEWLAKKENFNRFEDMVRPLRALFREVSFSWEPYIYWDLVSDMLIPDNGVEKAVAESACAMEEALIEADAISPVLFCFVGDKLQCSEPIKKRIA